MIQKKKKELRFIHITKNAGTTIEEVSKDKSCKYKSCEGWGRHDEQLRELSCGVPTRPIGYCRSNFNCFWHTPPRYFSKADLRSWLKKVDLFVVVRNPFTRVLSEFYCEYGGPRPECINECSTVSGLNSWICRQLRSVQMAVREGAILHGHWCPQHLYIFDKDGNRIVSESNVIRFEALSDDFEALMRQYDCPFSLVDAKRMLSSINTASNISEATSGGTVKRKFDFRDLSAETQDLIREVYKEDFTLFRYSTDPLKCREVPDTKLHELFSTQSSAGSVLPLIDAAKPSRKRDRSPPPAEPNIN